jgi:hypothetical protein
MSTCSNQIRALIARHGRHGRISTEAMQRMPDAAAFREKQERERGITRK